MAQSNTIQLTIPMLLMSWFGELTESWSQTKTGQGRSPYDWEDEEEDLDDYMHEHDLDFPQLDDLN